MTIPTFGKASLRVLSTPDSYLQSEEIPATSRSFQIRAHSGHLQLATSEQGALFGMAANLDAGEHIWLEARKLADASRSLLFTAGATLHYPGSETVRRETDERFEDLRQAMSLDFPNSVITVCELRDTTGSGNEYPVVLRGLPVLLADLNGDADEDLISGSPRELPDPKHVVLGACTTKTPLSDALQLLRASPDLEGLRLTLERRQLSSRDLRTLSELYRDLETSKRPYVLTGAQITRMADMAALVAAWLAAKSGVGVSLSLISPRAPGTALMSAYSTMFSLPPSARRDAVEPELNLSGCFVQGQRPPSFALEYSATRHLAPAMERLAPPTGEASGAFVGTTDDDAPVWLDDRSRSRHVVVCGATGTGKSTLLRNMISSDIRQGHAVILIDPHGDLYEDVLSIANRHQDVPVWAADTADLDFPYSLNLLQSAGGIYRQNFVCNQLIRLLKRSLYKNVPEGFGPMFEAYFRNAFLLLSDGGGGAFTISEMDRVFGDARFRRELLDACENEHVKGFWRNIAAKAGGEAALENIAPYIVSKLTQFVGNPVINPIVCARESTIDFSQILETGGVCIVNLAKGKVGTTEAEILGGIFTTALFSAALARGDRSQEDRRPVRVYLDEFQSYAGEVISEMLAECRKYGLELTLATQSLNRLKYMNGDLTQSVLGNTANIVALRSGPDDADLLSRWIGGGVSREEVMSLDDFRAVGRFLERGRVSLPVSFRLGDSAETG